ncbi:MAG: hypothetical protein OHM56_10225 [Spiroplasma phoeniceum]|nr:MAG: hypothetical protein OHM57_09635 [Spiroplasma phoeniceum]UZQ31948.1 MAG: hypothetical protein OHM56_10225 [Spiroplasma phoeniceum]
MQEYKSKYINKTWNEITTSFDLVNCKPVDCPISRHKNHYDLQCLEWTKMYLNLFEDKWGVINSYMQHYKINDILDLSSDGWKILQIDKKNKTNKLKYIIAIDPAGIGQTGIIIYKVLQNKIIKNITFHSKNEYEAINNIYLILNEFKNKTFSYLNKVLVIIEDYQLHERLKITNPLSTPKLMGGLGFLCKYLFNLKYVLQSPVVKKKYIYKGNIKMSKHEHDAWKHLQYFLAKGVDKNGTNKK